MAEVDDETTLEEAAALLDRIDTEQVALLLAAALQQGWENQVRRAMIRASNALQGGATEEEAIGLMRAELSGPMRARAAGPVREAVRSFYRIGQREVGLQGIGPTGTRTVGFMDDFTLFWIENHYERHVQERIRRVGAQNFRQGVGAFRSGQNFAESALGQQFSKSQSYWELLSNSVATRTREFSHIDGFVERGVEEVEVDAVLDVRTSCICRALNGTSFPVEDLQSHKEEMMNADTPEQVKDRSPWLSCERVRSLKAAGTDALIDAGVVSPPFHGHCRSSLIRPIPE